jgi:hypothetical protein
MLIEGELGEMSLLGCSTPVFTRMVFRYQNILQDSLVEF